MKTHPRLTDTRIKQTKPSDKPIKLTDGNGLYVLINPNDSRLWRYRYRLQGKENVFALGEFGCAPSGETPEAKALRIAGRTFTLADAREALTKARALVKSGVHPSTERADNRRRAAAARDTTFEGVAREWLARMKKTWKPASYRQRERLLEADVFPVIGKRPIAEIKRVELNEIILRIEARAPQMASLARQLLQAIFDHAEDIGAVAESIALRLTKVKKEKTTPARHLVAADIGPFLRDCDTYSGGFEIRTAMQLAWLTLARSMEVLESEWSEFDFEQAIWRIPAARMKMEREHIIPLSKQALELLGRLHGVTGKRTHLFPNKNDPSRPASHGGLWKMVNSIGWSDKFTPHGIRRTASTIMNESNLWNKDVIEWMLAHADENKTRAAYNAAEYLPLRQDALQWWANLLDAKHDGGEGAEIFHLPRLRQVI